MWQKNKDQHTKKKTSEEVTKMKDMTMKEVETYFVRVSRAVWKIFGMEEPNQLGGQSTFLTS